VATEEIIQIADEVVRLINEAAVPGIGADPAVVASRAYLPDADIPELAETQAVVVPGTIGTELATRDAHRFDYEVHIGVRRKVSTSANTEIDAMIAITRQLLDIVRSGAVAVPGLPAGRPTVARIDPIFDPETLRESGVFFSIIRATYPATRKVI